MKPWTPLLFIVSNALSMSLSDRTSTGITSIPKDSAAVRVIRRMPGIAALSGFATNPARVDPGMTALSSFTRYETICSGLLAKPVTVPPGRSKLAASFAPTGSPIITSGVAVSRFTIVAAGVPGTKITFTSSRTRSATRLGIRSKLPSANRLSMTNVSPRASPVSAILLGTPSRAYSGAPSLDAGPGQRIRPA